MSSFKKTVIKSYPRFREEVTVDSLYWKLEPPVIKREYGAISYVHFSQCEPYNFAVTNSTRVHIYSAQTNQIERTITRFKQTAYSGSFRSDGSLLVAGGEEGVVRLFGVEKNSLLRVFKGHTAPVHITHFTCDNVRLFSASDDLSLRLWDVATEVNLATYKEHKDFIRCGTSPSSSPDIILTGGYDHVVKMYDTRLKQSVMSIDHGCPVESVIIFPSGGLFFSAGGNYIKVWDTLAGGKLLKQICHHHKPITSLGFCSNYQRLLSGSLDRHVKMYDISTYQVVHTLDYAGSVLSAAASPNDSCLVMGTTDGLLSIQHRKKEIETREVKSNQPQKSSFHYSVRARRYFAREKDDMIIKNRRKEVLSPWDKQLKQFNHSRALDCALDWKVRSKNPEIVISVLQELIRRDVIKSALAGRDERQLQVLLKFIIVNIDNINFMPTLIDVANILLSLYSSTMGQSGPCSEALVKLQTILNEEVKYLKVCSQTLGSMDMIFAAAELNNQSTTK